MNRYEYNIRNECNLYTSVYALALRKEQTRIRSRYESNPSNRTLLSRVSTVSLTLNSSISVFVSRCHFVSGQRRVQKPYLFIVSLGSLFFCGRSSVPLSCLHSRRRIVPFLVNAKLRSMQSRDDNVLVLKHFSFWSQYIMNVTGEQLFLYSLYVYLFFFKILNLFYIYQQTYMTSHWWNSQFNCVTLFSDMLFTTIQLTDEGTFLMGVGGGVRYMF